MLRVFFGGGAGYQEADNVYIGQSTLLTNPWMAWEDSNGMQRKSKKLKEDVIAVFGTPFGPWKFSDIELYEVIERVSTGHRLPNPSKLGFTCEKAAYNLMLDCWAAEPETRPTFRDVCFLLKDMFSGDEDIYASID
ncbi:hypothetical protein SprV_0501946500 [Sparganum proliferum]